MRSSSQGLAGEISKMTDWVVPFGFSVYGLWMLINIQLTILTLIKMKKMDSSFVYLRIRNNLCMHASRGLRSRRQVVAFLVSRRHATQNLSTAD